MFVFVCAGCGAELTAPLTQVALPVHAHQSYGNGVQLPVLMQPGTFAVDPESWGRPRRMRDEGDPAEAEERGVHAPVPALSDGTPGAYVIAPGDIRGTRLLPEARGIACCGFGGADGPNTACSACGLLVATRIDDCSLWQSVRLDPDAVRRIPVDGPGPAPLSWAELAEHGEKTPPVEPVATWGGRPEHNHFWSWSPRWEAAAGHALAHLLEASEGHPVRVPDGLTTDMFQRVLDVLLPEDGPERHAALAGPGQPAPDPDAEILLVPIHPRTGDMWAPDGPAASAHRVPLPLGVWRRLVEPEQRTLISTTSHVPRDVLDEDEPPQTPGALFRPDWRIFDSTVARLPVARSPWLSPVLERLRQGRWIEVF
ncbi:hypothetical protein [Streptomyces thermoalcalitolerans]|uniref:Uncharacterized protein n=1 Tax=Streptomyces thermoalcalitolerans TaxID=65605 RepID=A0ABP3YSM3_9ACTN